MSFRQGTTLMSSVLKPHMSLRSLYTTARPVLQPSSSLRPLFSPAAVRFAKASPSISGNDALVRSSRISSVILDLLGRRSFTTSSRDAIRETYFPDTRSGGPKPSSWYSRLDDRLERFGIQRIIYIIIGINVAVFLAWQYAQISYDQGDRSLLALMHDNFLLSWQNLNKGRYWTIITAAFSHKDHWHLAFNMLGFYFFSGALMQMIGPLAFLGVYFGGALVSHGVSLWDQNRPRQRRNRVEVSGLGASGAVYALMGCVGVLQPFSTIIVYFIPVPAWGALAGISAYELYQMATVPAYKASASVVHFSGLVFGGLVALFFRRRSPSQYRMWRELTRR